MVVPRAAPPRPAPGPGPARGWLRALLAVLLAVVAPAAGARGAPEGRPLTALEAGPLGRSDLVVVGDVGTVGDARGLLVAEVRVVRVLKGESPGPSITVLVLGHRPTRDREHPSVPWLGEEERGRHVFFLRAASGGEAFELVSLFDATGPVGTEKADAVAAQVAILADPDPEARAHAMLVLLVRSLAAEGVWTRVNAARELGHLATVRPDLFTLEVRRHLARVRARTTLPTQRRWLAGVLAGLGDATATDDEAPETTPDPAGAGDLAAALAAAPDGEAAAALLRDTLTRRGRAALPALLEVLPSAPPAARAYLVGALADAGWREALPRLLARYANEDDPETQVAIVRAAGRLGDDAVVGWLEDRLANPRTRRPVLFALARLGTPAAREALLRAPAAADATERNDIEQLVDYLASGAFEEAERLEGRTVGGDR